MKASTKPTVVIKTMKKILTTPLITTLATILILTTLTPFTLAAPSTKKVNPPKTQSKATKIVQAARSQIGKTIDYNPAYAVIPYPMGDIPIEKGVCTDVLIRALRTALKYDLQKQVHLDMRRNFSKYPKIWGLKRPDKNIDHRRVPNLQTFLKRKGFALKITKNPTNYKPGDIVTCRLGNLPHIMIVSDRKTTNGTPLIIHNIGSGAEEENSLFTYPLTGHYRLKL